MLTLYVPTRPLPPSAVQVAFEVKLAPLKGAKTVVAVLVMLAKPDPKHGDVVELTAPHRAAASTAICRVLSAHRSQPVCMIPRIKARTGMATKANSTTVAPQVFLNKDLILLYPDYDARFIVR